MASALWNVLRRDAAVEHNAMIAALADLDAADWRHGEPDVEPLAGIPPLAHEIMYRRVAGLRVAIEHATRHVRQV